MTSRPHHTHGIHRLGDLSIGTVVSFAGVRYTVSAHGVEPPTMRKSGLSMTQVRYADPTAHLEAGAVGCLPSAQRVEVLRFASPQPRTGDVVTRTVERMRRRRSA